MSKLDNQFLNGESMAKLNETSRFSLEEYHTQTRRIQFAMQSKVIATLALKSAHTLRICMIEQSQPDTGTSVKELWREKCPYKIAN